MMSVESERTTIIQLWLFSLNLNEIWYLRYDIMEFEMLKKK